MKNYTILAFLVLSLMTVSCGEKRQMPTQINFITDFDQAKTIAGESGKPMIIDFDI